MQGDPLSPFLFFQGMQELTQLLDSVKDLQWIKGFQVSGNPNTSVTCSHLLYAEMRMMLLSFAGADSQQVNASI